MKKQKNLIGFSLIEVIIGLALVIVIFQAIYRFYLPLYSAFDKRQTELSSLENTIFLLEKLFQEVRFTPQILDTPNRPTNSFNFSFIDSENREVTYYLDETIIKRKLDAVQPLTEEGLILNLKKTPVVPLFKWDGKLLKICLVLKNKSLKNLILTQLIALKN